MPPLLVMRSQAGYDLPGERRGRSGGFQGKMDIKIPPSPVSQSALKRLSRCSADFKTDNGGCKERGKDQSESIRQAAEQISTGEEHHVHVSTTVATVHNFTSFHLNLFIMYHNQWKKSTLDLLGLLWPEACFGVSKEAPVEAVSYLDLLLWKIYYVL